MSGTIRNYSASLTALFMALLVLSCAKERDVKSRVISYLGTVNITRGIEAQRSVVLGEELKDGDRIVTGRASFVVFSTGGAAVARIQPESDVVLTSIADMSKIDLGLDKGCVLSRVNKLAKGAGYRVTTSTVVASVRGTLFSVNTDEGSGAVAVKTGMVRVAVRNSGKSLDVNGGAAVLFTGELAERPIEDAESIILENMESLPADLNADAGERPEEINRQIIEKDREINRKLEDKGIPRTLEDIKARYERIDEVTLYSGRVIRGIIMERGVNLRLLTPSGYINIPAKKVRNTRVLK